MPLAKLEAFDAGTVALAAFAKALAHPARIMILQHLSGKGELACMSIVEALPLSQPACSRHINEITGHRNNQFLLTAFMSMVCGVALKELLAGHRRAATGS
jgi:DNA-binding transcriptional ArsR family regulator